MLLTLASPAATLQLGTALAACLPDGVTVGLIGTLGAGKTQLVRAIAVACGVPAQQVTSPTYTLCHEYVGRRCLDHLDLYRVRDEDELAELGLDEYFESPHLKLIEWSDRFPQALPADRLEIELEVLDPESRRCQICVIGTLDATFLSSLQQELRAVGLTWT